MDKCPIRLHVDGDSNKSNFICSLCECPLGMHTYFVHCPLLEDELICIDCCQNDIEKAEAIQQFKELGKEYSREFIEKTCIDCGNRSCGLRLPEEKI